MVRLGLEYSSKLCYKFRKGNDKLEQVQRTVKVIMGLKRKTDEDLSEKSRQWENIVSERIQI